ncbi:hypothetical protein HUJ04_003048 [Dendroctonus ponderosae]|nr:hypothetical protein HUJ04_003048 [Dendroctonus ponderosae]KAH1023935.1 hypothetical protein HUJ05_003509 [Dendroctonus ponderosae]
MAENQLQFSILPKILNGGIAGMIGVACTFPTDLVKTRLQKQQIGPDGTKMYDGIKLSTARQGLAGALTGVVQLVVTVPMELLKIQLQDAGRVAAMEAKQTGKPVTPNISALKVFSDLIRSRGFFGLYKGTFATMCRDVPFCGVYFPVFAKLDSFGPRKLDGSGDAKFYWSFICALSTASCTAVMVTPSDIMKTRIQSISKGAAGDKTYGSVKDAFKDILQHEGIKGFYKGGACRILVLAPTYAIIQGIYFLGVAEKIFGLKRDIKVVK